MQVAEPLIAERVAPAVLTIALQALLIYLLAAGLGVVRKPWVPPPTKYVDVPAEIKPTPPDPVNFDPNRNSFTRNPDIPLTKPIIEIEESKRDNDSERRDDIIDVSGKETIELPVAAPRLVKSFEPPYPSPSILQGEEGVVQVRVTIAPNGAIGAASIERSSGFPRLDEAALKAVRQWRFAPAMRGSQAVVGSKVVAVRFQLKLR